MLAAVGLSSGQTLLFSVSNQTEPEVPLADSGSIVTVSNILSGNMLPEPVSSSNAALTIVTLCEQHEAAVTSAQLSPDCNNLATISSDGAVLVWDTFAGSHADLYVASRSTIAGAACAAWLPGKRLLIGTSSRQLVVSPYTSDQFSGVFTTLITYFHIYHLQKMRINVTKTLLTNGVPMSCVCFHVASFVSDHLCR